ncbi:hypothetical protein LSUE1_G009173 [Lachnellula suecica]|uniref:BTB domain-containing protein n=1 Tax=Lachnellula suecica TaxID=602035 RepID=A0A8T9C0J3_9HELO|nr:hypothetical protein LSUE1_G009173 [Lachnellula suecica]
MERTVDIHYELNCCVCKVCKLNNDYQTEDAEQCQRIARILEHNEEVSRIIVECPDIATIVVGPLRIEIKCHKSLLAFKSEYFDAAFFGNFASSQTCITYMEDDDPTELSVFVAWLYTGRIPASCLISPAFLWVLGDKLRSPGFANEAMYFLFEDFKDDIMTPGTAEYVYANTSTGSKLRAVVKDVILNEGPFYPYFALSDAELEGWKDLIRQKNDLVVDISLEGAFNRNNPNLEDRAYFWKNHYKYLEPITTRSIEDFLQGVPRGGTG